MSTFKEFLNESKKMREWVFDKLENSSDDSEAIEQEFIKKFGKQHQEKYQDYVSEYMGD